MTHQKNTNERVSYDKPTEICHVMKIFAENNQMERTLVGYKYSYEYQSMYSKSFHWVLPSCNHEHYDRTLEFDINLKGLQSEEYNITKFNQE